MPTVFERIDVSLQDNGLAGALASQIGKLTDAATKVKALASNPPAAIPQLAAGVGAVNLPALDVSAFAGGIASLEGAIPSDLSALTQAITAALDGLKAGVKADVTIKLDTYVEAVRAVQRLLNANFAPPPDLFKSEAEINASAGSGAPGGASGAGAGTGTGTGTGAGSGGAAGAPGAGGAGPGVSASAPPTPAEAAAQARARRLEAINRSNAFLATRQPFDAPGFVVFLRDTLVVMPREQAKVRKIPYFDDLLWLVSTAVALRAMDDAGLRQHIEETLSRLTVFLNSAGDWPLGHAVTSLDALAAKLDAAALSADTQTLTASLDAIAAALASGDLAATSPQIAAANATLDSLLPRLGSLDSELFDGQVDHAIRMLTRLPLELDRQMRRVAQAVAPSNQLGLYATMGAELRASLSLAAPEAVGADLRAMFAELTDALRSFDLGPLRDVLATAIAGLNAAADQIDSLLTGVAAQVALAFDALDDKLAAIDPAPLVAQVNQSIAALSQAIAQQVNALFAPVQSAIAQALGEIAAAVAGFDPTQLVDALEDAIQKLADVLAAPEVTGAIDAIRQTIEGVADQINALSFAPVTGGVVVEIDAVTALLKKVDPSLLGMPAKLALTGAVELLPDDLKPVTDPVQAAFGDLIDAGPKPILEQVEAQPQRLLDQVKRYSPDKLLGDELGAPLAALIRELETFKPSALLAPVEQALDGLKQDLARRANPAQAFAPIESAFDAVLARLDALNPAQLVAPLSASMSAAIDTVVTALPADEITVLLDDVLGFVKHVSDMAKAGRTALESLETRFADLVDGEAQIRAWYAPVLARVAAMDDVGALQPGFDAVAQALERLKAAAIVAALDGTCLPLRTALDGLAPATRLAALGRAYRGIRPQVVAALPASAEKTALQALLLRFSPATPSFARPFEGLERWNQALERDRPAVLQLMQHWDARFHGAAGALAGFVHPAITGQALRTLISDALEREVIRPLGALVGAVHQVSRAGAPVITELSAFAAAFEERIDALVLGPAALGGLRDAYAGLITRLRAIDLDFLTRELDATFSAVKAKLTAVGPAAVKTAVQAAFDQALANLDVGKLLPATALATLDQTHAELLDGLRALDPKKVVIETVQPVFDEKIVPLLAQFDISVVLRALIERLDALKVELTAEFKKVDDAYKAMLAAVPTISLTDISLDVDIDVGVDVGF